MIRHLEGTPIRKLAAQLELSKSNIQRIISKTLKKVPNSNHISEIVCKHFCHVLLVDGKYIHVKGFEKKIPLLWGIDYQSHDPVIHQLAPSENYQSYLNFFRQLKNINYPLDILICDENDSLIYAAKFHYPNVKIQLCLNHIKEGIRRTLQSRTNPTHEHFVKQIEHLFRKQTIYEYSKYAVRLTQEHTNNPLYLNILLELNRKHEFLIRHLVDKRAPATNNLIESFNSHLEARVRSLKGFESFNSAELWLNAYVMNRRLSKFTDCSGKFKHLNNTAPIAHTAMYDAQKVSLLKKVR